MPTSAILTFLFGYASIFLLVLLPSLLLLLTRRRVGLSRLIWAAAAITPAIIWYPRARMGPDTGIVISTSWLVYLGFLYYSGWREPSENRPRKRTSTLISASLLFVLLVASVAQSVRVSHQCKRAHSIYWPVDLASSKWAALHIPAAFGCLKDDSPADRQMAASRNDTGVMEERVLRLDILWPGMEPVSTDQLDTLDNSPGHQRVDIELKSGAIKAVRGKPYNALQAALAVDMSSRVKKCAESVFPAPMGRVTKMP
jgi:hypothetical protein